MLRVKNNKPYWLKCQREAICIYHDGFECGFGYFGNLFSRLSEAMKRFQNNKQIFIVIKQNNMIWNNNELLEDEKDDDSAIMAIEEIEFILDYTADVIFAEVKEKQLKTYRIRQFENWVYHFGLRLTKKFPKKEIVEQIVAFRSENKSELMKKVLQYVQKERKKEDFSVLKKFKVLNTEEYREKNGSKKMEYELIAMEAVKEQVRSIVDVMKYSQCREKMGLGKTSYHNVHLLIGGPGTAKTTVA